MKSWNVRDQTKKMMVETEKTHKGVNKWHTEAERVEATRSDLPRLQSG